MTARISIFILLVLAASCSLNLTQPAMDIQRLQLEYEKPVYHAQAKINSVMRVKRFSSLPAYERPEIVYSRGKFERAVDYYTLWMTRPSELISSLLISDLETSELFSAVISSLSGLLSDYEMEGVVMEFLDDVSDKGGRQALLVVQVTVSKSNPSRDPSQLLLQKTYTQIQPYSGSGGQKFASAMSACMKAFSTGFIQDIETAIQSAPTSTKKKS
jgi:ABC-type uncharacterized transport system auxiliary subunit